jgi:peroxiredoxin
MRSVCSAIPLIVVMLTLACSPGVESGSGAPGEPDFRLATLDGTHLGPRDFHGRVVLFDFWATWCAPCHVQADILKAIYDEFRAHDVEFVAVSVGEAESTVRSFVSRRPFPYPVLIDPRDEVASGLGIFVLPTIMILDAEGRVAYLQEGISSARRLRESLSEALAGSRTTGL